MFLKKNRGFTLIELLVVIAIIGILAAIVLTSLGTAREKARNASAQASMSQMRAEAELGTNTSGQYVADLCTASATGGLDDLTTAVENQLAGSVACGQDAAAAARPLAWGAAVDLDGAAGVFCVDSTGYSGVTAAADAATEIADGAASTDVVCDGL